MGDENDVLRPYPIDPSQDKVIRKIVFAKRDLIPRITSFLFDVITYPLMILSKSLSKGSIVEDGEEKSFSEIGPIYVSTRTNAMDSKYFYVVRDEKIWFKPIAAHPSILNHF
ncbi:unnamed protein product, partial [Rotaria sp. Silwood2]